MMLVLTAWLDECCGSCPVFSVSSYQLLGWTSLNGLMNVSSWISTMPRVMNCVGFVSTPRLDEFYGSCPVFAVSSYQLLGWTSLIGLMHVCVHELLCWAIFAGLLTEQCYDTYYVDIEDLTGHDMLGTCINGLAE